MTLFDAAALNVYFEDAGSMGLSNRTCLQLAHKGIADPKDFKEFDEDGLTVIFSNLYKSPKIPATGAAAIAAGRLCENPWMSFVDDHHNKDRRMSEMGS
jgi:hypothetical protein